MSFYLVRGSYTSASLKAMVAAPQDRQAAIKPMMDSLGATLHQMYFCFGQDDFVAIIEAPDDETMAAGLLVVGASGSISNLNTTKLITTEEAMSAMGKAGKVASGYSPAS